MSNLKRKFRRLAAIWLITVLCVYALFCGALYFAQENLLYHPPASRFPDGIRPGYEEHVIGIDSAGTTVAGYYVERPGQPLLIHYGGNGDEAANNIDYYARQLPYSLLMLDYRGYGRSGGSPSQKAIVGDALRAYDVMVEERGHRPEDIFLVGQSLGSGVAVQVAARREVGGLVLITPYDSIRAISQDMYPFVPVGPLLRHPFDSAELAADIDAPALFLVAEKDEIIPAKHSERLRDVWKGEVDYQVMPRMSHNTVLSYGQFFPLIEAFVERKRRR